MHSLSYPREGISDVLARGSIIQVLTVCRGMLGHKVEVGIRANMMQTLVTAPWVARTIANRLVLTRATGNANF